MFYRFNHNKDKNLYVNEDLKQRRKKKKNICQFNNCYFH